MKNIFLCFTFCVFLFAVNADAASSDRPQSHTFYLKSLTSARDSVYSYVLRKYDMYIQDHPADFLIAIERCRFTDKAYYDNDEDYNPKSDESSGCLEDLVARFPGVPEVLLYKAESLYGDSAKAFLQFIISDIDDHPQKWEGKEIWQVYNKLANIYVQDKLPKPAIEYAKLAQKFNDTLDLTILLAEQYKELSQNNKAINVLVSKLDSTNKGWELSRKGKLLLELGDADDAVRAYRMAAKDSTAYYDDESIAKALMETGKYSEARLYLVKGSNRIYMPSGALRKLFSYDLAHSPADSAFATYKRLTAESFSNDPVGFNRLRLFIRAPFHKWTFTDLLRLFCFFLLIIWVMVMPYLWVLPIHYVGSYLKSRGMVLVASEFRWGLKHFWIASSLLLLVNVLGLLLFNNGMLYPNVMEDSDTVSKPLADFSLFCFIGFMLSVFSLVRKPDLKLIWGHLWTKRRSVLTGLAALIIVQSALKLYLYALNATHHGIDVLSISSIVDDILSINKFYHPLVGFLFVVILVPFYEEILFRGVFLSALEKNMKFFFANCLQSFIFALLHQQLKLFPFFFVFGMVTGYLRRNSQSLAPGISFHMINNFLAFMSTMYMQ
ncbi:MAG: family intrarane metalloprotease [Bacteroidota bacterium]|nr:family intrarane metalloprotease [Bacteroidota bacterium]